MSYTVRDSSLLRPMSSNNTVIPGSIRVGMVVDQFKSKELNADTYVVEVNSHGRRYRLTCQHMAKFGHPYHYESFSLHKNETTPTLLPVDSYAARSGEIVVVAELPNAEGIIIGCLKHPSRKSQLSEDSTYLSSFNGLKKEIKTDGSYKVTFNGAFLPNVKLQLKAPIMLPTFPEATIHNPLVAGSYYGFEKDGSFEVSDAAKVLPQSIKIDKTSGTTKITSGLVTINIDKKTQKIQVACIDADISAKKSFNVSSAQVEISGLTGVKIKGAKIAIGFGGVELIDSIVKLIDAIGLLVVPHHLGPCSPITGSPTWIQVELIKAKLTLIKGSL